MMSAYSEDLRRRIVSSVEAGMPKAQAARTFSVSLSSVKRYVKRAEGWGSLAPKDKPGAAPKLDGKAMKLLEEDLKERPQKAPPPFTTSTLQQTASTRLHFAAQRTMQTAQRLYEGVELGSEGSV